MPGAECVVIRGAGHFLSLDAPEELTSAILGWVGTRERRAPAGSSG